MLHTAASVVDRSVWVVDYRLVHTTFETAQYQMYVADGALTDEAHLPDMSSVRWVPSDDAAVCSYFLDTSFTILRV